MTLVLFIEAKKAVVVLMLDGCLKIIYRNTNKEKRKIERWRKRKGPDENIIHWLKINLIFCLYFYDSIRPLNWIINKTKWLIIPTFRSLLLLKIQFLIDLLSKVNPLCILDIFNIFDFNTDKVLLLLCCCSPLTHLSYKSSVLELLWDPLGLLTG